MIIQKVLIANRGEIARRIIRTCRERGIQTVAVYSEADANMPFVREADESIFIGPSAVSKSYLNIEQIIEAAKRTNADAIHPGYGLLSENAVFAKRVIDQGILFIGPDPTVIHQMGDKIKARKMMQEANIAVVPGYSETISTVDEACQIAESIGFPVMLKASAGGGGIGMQLCHGKSDINKAFDTARARAKAYFGNDAMFIEKYIESPHHIEVQIAGDQQGNVIHLLERECSIQRRHQKVIEESPSPFIDELTREKICEAAVRAGVAVGYTGLGTVEFIMGADKQFYFLEMNTRLQVEHPVTEEILKLDLVNMQLDIAQGKKIDLRQEDVKAVSHAMELRIYAEDPKTFLPSPGKITEYVRPIGVGIRLDDGVECGTVVTPFYDPMIGKLVVSGVDRAQSLERAQMALKQLKIEGIRTNIPLLEEILKHHEFQQGSYDTTFIQKNIH